MKILQNIGIITLVLISMFYINELFGSQLRVFRSAVNSIILPFGIALFMSYLLQPLVTLLEEKLKIKKRILTILIVFVIVVIVVMGYLEGVSVPFIASGTFYFPGFFHFVDNLPDVVVFHAGTTLCDGQVVTNGGRVLGVTAMGQNTAQAQAKAYEAVERIHFEGAYCRSDIASKAIST